MTDFYEILGVSPDADAEAIKAAYKKKAKETHPDAGGDAELFSLISAAYETLKDDAKRLEYNTLKDDPTGRAKDALNLIKATVDSVLRDNVNRLLRINVVDKTKESLRQSLNITQRTKMEAEDRFNKLQKARDKYETRLKYKSESMRPNLYFSIMDTHLAEGKIILDKLTQNEQTGKLALEWLDDYDLEVILDEDDATPHRLYVQYHNTTA